MVGRTRRVATLASAALIALCSSPAAAAAQPAATAGGAPRRASEAPLTSALEHRLSRGVTHRVIVELRNGLAATAGLRAGLREQAAATVQRPVLSELHLTGSRDVHGLALVDDVVATVSGGEEARLRADPAVAAVVPDVAVHETSPTVHPGGASPGAARLPAGACTTGKAVQLDPEALGLIHAATQSGKGAAAQALGYTGAGVKVGFIADGIDTNNPDFVRPGGQHVFVDYQDFSGWGTGSPTAGGEAFLDASSIAAQGRQVYDLRQYGSGLATPCRIRILGAAPGASLVGLDVFGNGVAWSSTILQAINWAVLHDHVNVLNESLGTNPFPDVAAFDLIKQANALAAARGVTVTVASGDAGPTGTVGSPATDPGVIAAGATTSYRAYLQAGVTPPTPVTTWLDNNMSAMSSGGVDQQGGTVDVVAPGDLNWALCSPSPLYQSCTNDAGRPSSFQLAGGTSEAAPLTAGVAALVIQAYRDSHGGASPSPAVVEQLITSTAENVQSPGDQQGAGMLDAYAAVLAARSYPGRTGPPVGHAVLTSSDQLTAAAAPGTTETLSETLTNDGNGPVSLVLSSRMLGAETPVDAASASLAAGAATKETFTVPAGQARLDAQIAYTSPSVSSADLNSAAGVYLLAPDGALAAYSLPQGMGAHGEATVADPQPGTWTAVIQAGSTATTVQFAAQVATWVPLGTLSAPTLRLAAGASGTVTLDATTPATPGDQAGQLTIRSTAAAPAFTLATSVPVVLRSYVPTPAPTTTFTGTLTGGNGRAPSTGQSAYYQLQVPAGEPALAADITVASKQDTFYAQLIAPDGMVGSMASSSLAANGLSTARLNWQDGAQLHVVSPAAGTWTLAINFYNRVSGTQVFQPYTVTLSTAAVAVSAPSLPDSAATTLPAGQATTVDVSVTNGGTSPEEYFVDARLPTSTTVSLSSGTVGYDLVPNPASGLSPLYLVPSHSTSLTATAVAPGPATVEAGFEYGDPDVASAPGTTPDPTVTVTAPSGALSSGVWFVVADRNGPAGVKGFPPTRIPVAMTATTAAFDPAVSAPTGDLWQAASNPAAAFSPIVVQPGQTATIPVTITPAGAAGTVVSGTLYVDTYDPVNATASLGTPGVLPGGSDVAALPYSYTVGS